MTRDRSGDDVAPTQVATADPTVRADASGRPADRASHDDYTLPADGAPEGGARFAPGAKVGRYEIVGLIGRGGMGEVYAAYDPQLDRAVAIKVLLAEIRSDAAAARLVREAQSLARLTHPNVVAVYDAGEDRGHVYLAMQFVDGETLLSHLLIKKRTWQEIVALYLEAGRGLAAAHAAGMVHRDFKPSNVLVDKKTGQIAVTDFGVARASGDPAEADASASAVTASISGKRASRPSDVLLTRQGELVGTPVYMSAEQFAGGATSVATDQFAFCVAVWEALFERHPYFAGEGDGTPLAYAEAVQQNPLIIPDRPVAPRRVVAALARGLARDPDQRWPSMDALLRELARAGAPQRWPWIAAAGALVAAGVGVALAFALGAAAAPPLCPEPAEARLAAAWGPAQHDALAAGFAATNRAYAAKVAEALATELDDYGARWTKATTEACAAAGGDGSARAAAAGRVACLDRAYAGFAAAIRTFTADVGPEVVDRSQTSVEALPVIADCAADATASPPPAVARRLAELEPRLQDAAALIRIGNYTRGGELLAALDRDAAGFAWEPFQVRIAYRRADLAVHLGHASYADLVAIAGRAEAVGARRLALEAWSEAMLWAPDLAALDTADAAAGGAAAALGGGRLALEVSLSHARGLIRKQKWPQAASLCRDGLTTARANGWVRAEERAADCMAESLVPMGKLTELEPILEWDIAAKMARVGADHPAVADLLLVRASILQHQGKLAEAETATQRALDIRKRAFGEKDLRVADATRELAGVVMEAGETDRGIALAGEALAILETHTSPPDNELYQVHRDLGMFTMMKQDFPTVRNHFDLAIAAAERYAGADSLEVGFLLLMYGQYQTAWDVDLGIATLRRTIDIFEAHEDGRVAVVRGALAAMLQNNKRWREARELLEDAIAKVDRVNTPPGLVGHMYKGLARVLLKTKGDRRRAHELADTAAAFFAKANQLDDRQDILEWVEANHLPAYVKTPAHQ